MDSPPQTSADKAPGDSLANRYGPGQSDRRSFGSRWGKWIAGAAVVAAVAVAGWFALDPSKDSLSWKDVGYTIDSPTRASVTFEVTKDYQDTVECAIQVLSENYAIVGWHTVTIGPTEPGDLPSDKSRYYDVDLRTDALGVSGGVDSCWIEQGD
ncbi:DUF4307 domain-containing protein (plasmid) [Citricoccus sp. SGAir0253]|uniref:DUF4307 domain-containing protein n=1 Tax=Citricoccus sp. SGAir0253 TaxID=2567881 RepID=UPI0010CD36E8|nr:DUF4307 domain-containing protein [Citricoccus sp. SGAir0253]QCU79680.1 DUF4307 domain-containing protein [Citricoccus sp. SGAir0253]